MEKLRLRTGNMELKAEGSAELIQREREAFYQHIKEAEEANIKAKADLMQKMKSDVAWYARARQEKDADNARKPMVVRTCGELRGTWEEIAAAIKSGAEFKVGDYVKSRMQDGSAFTAIVVDVTENHVRFESRDCVGKEVQWNIEDKTAGGFPESYICRYLNGPVYNLIPEDLKEFISPATRYHVVDGEKRSYECKLFLPAASEMFGNDDCYGDEGVYEQLEYYKDRRNRMKGEADGEDTCDWWLASVGSGWSSAACGVHGRGLANYWSASNELRVPLCFQIKKS